MFKVNNTTSKQRQRRPSERRPRRPGVFFVNIRHNSHTDLMFSLLTLNK